jgi:hypothetical protein
MPLNMFDNADSSCDASASSLDDSSVCTLPSDDEAVTAVVVRQRCDSTAFDLLLLIVALLLIWLPLFANALAADDPNCNHDLLYCNCWEDYTYKTGRSRSVDSRAYHEFPTGWSIAFGLGLTGCSLMAVWERYGRRENVATLLDPGIAWHRHKQLLLIVPSGLLVIVSWISIAAHLLIVGRNLEPLFNDCPANVALGVGSLVHMVLWCFGTIVPIVLCFIMFYYDPADCFGVQTLDVSDNSFGKPVVGDQVKIKSSGEMKTVTAKNTGLLRNPTNFQPLIPAWTRNAVHVHTGFLGDVYQR